LVAEDFNVIIPAKAGIQSLSLELNYPRQSRGLSGERRKGAIRTWAA
jgi:hypothetical protein